MWFKNIHFYKFESPFGLTADAFAEALQSHRARRCGQMEMGTAGWSVPVGTSDDAPLVHQNGGDFIFSLRREEKVLPASLVRERVEEEAEKLEAEKGFPVSRKQRRDLKDQVMQELLPRALVRSSHLYAAILPASGWLIINAASAKRCDEFLELLRKSLGTLNVVIPATGESPEGAMTRWLASDDSLPAGFAVEDACEMVMLGESTGVIRCRNIDIARSDVRAHVEAGCRVRRLALNWQDRISFMLHDDLSLHRIRFDSALLDEAGDDSDDELARFDADFAIMAAEFEQLIPELLAALEGNA